MRLHASSTSSGVRTIPTRPCIPCHTDSAQHKPYGLHLEASRRHSQLLGSSIAVCTILKAFGSLWWLLEATPGKLNFGRPDFLNIDLGPRMLNSSLFGLILGIGRFGQALSKAPIGGAK